MTRTALDACSSCFDLHDPKRDQHKADVKAATQELVKNLIPSIVAWREKHAEELEVSITDVIGYLHAFGVNLRHDRSLHYELNIDPYTIGTCQQFAVQQRLVVLRCSCC